MLKQFIFDLQHGVQFLILKKSNYISKNDIR